MFAFIAKHRGIWPVDWTCGALGVPRGGVCAWLTRPRSKRSRDDKELSAKVRASFMASDRTHGARRIWHDVMADGIDCGRHRMRYPGHFPLRMFGLFPADPFLDGEKRAVGVGLVVHRLAGG